MTPAWSRWRAGVGLLVALAVVGFALALPDPRPTGPDPGAPADADPNSLAGVFPAAKPWTFSGELPGGRSYQPFLIVDRTTSIGLTTNSDATRSTLIVRVGDEIRVLHQVGGAQLPSTVAAVTLHGDDLFWLETGEDADGARMTTLWRAGLRGGEPSRLATDASDVRYVDSAFDLQVADGALHWAAAAPGRADAGEVRSVSIKGGPVRVRRLTHPYALTAWPWATTSGTGRPGPVEMLNLDTGARRTIPAGPKEILDCSPVWCRITTLVNQGRDLTVDVKRVDGTGRRAIGGITRTPLNTDVALLDRFEVLSSPVSTSAIASSVRLSLHDLRDDRVVTLESAASDGFGSRSGFVWWSTGDNETVQWHVLDLRELGSG